MSADNGVYIAVFPTADRKSIEYRVIHAQAIENVLEPEQPWHEECVKEYFSDAKVFDTAEKAYMEARKIAKEVTSWAPLEYGISDIGTFEKPYAEYAAPTKVTGNQHSWQPTDITKIPPAMPSYGGKE